MSRTFRRGVAPLCRRAAGAIKVEIKLNMFRYKSILDRDRASSKLCDILSLRIRRAKKSANDTPHRLVAKIKHSFAWSGASCRFVRSSLFIPRHEPARGVASNLRFFKKPDYRNSTKDVGVRPAAVRAQRFERPRAGRLAGTVGHRQMARLWRRERHHIPVRNSTAGSERATVVTVCDAVRLTSDA